MSNHTLCDGSRPLEGPGSGPLGACLPSPSVLSFLTPLEWSIALAAVFGGALVQGTIGFGLGVLAIPILALVDPAFLPVPIQIVSLAVVIPAIVRERGNLDVRGAGLVLVGRAPGAAIGIYALSLLSERSLGVVVGVTVLLGVAAMARGWSIPITPTTQVATGVVSGAMALATGVGGPPVGMLYRSKSGPSMRSTLAAIFFFGLLMNLFTLAIAGRIGPLELALSAALTPAVFAGFLASSLLTSRVPAEVVRAGVLVLSATSAIALLATLAFD